MKDNVENAHLSGARYGYPPTCPPQNPLYDAEWISAVFDRVLALFFCLGAGIFGWWFLGHVINQTALDDATELRKLQAEKEDRDKSTRYGTKQEAATLCQRCRLKDFSDEELDRLKTDIDMEKARRKDVRELAR